MFKLTNQQPVKPKIKQVYQIGTSLPVLPAEKLLGNELRSLIYDLQNQINLPDDYFQILYQKVINNFAEFVQSLPADDDYILSGLLNRGLARAILASRQYMTQVDGEPDPLITYAIFTAALFYGVGKVLTRFSIALSAKVDDDAVEQWKPFAGSMLGIGNYYQIFPQMPNLELEFEANALLARQLLPNEAFLWLSSDNGLFMDWLLALRGGNAGQGGRICDALALIKHEELYELLSILTSPPVDVVTVPETKEAVDFFMWLRDYVDQHGNKLYNRGLHHFEGEFFMESELFQFYLGEKQEQIKAEVLTSQLERLFQFTRHDITNKQQVFKRNFSHSETVKQTNNARTTAFGLLNAKKQFSFSLPENLLLRKGDSITRTATNVHRLPLLTVISSNNNTRTPRLN